MNAKQTLLNGLWRRDGSISGVYMGSHSVMSNLSLMTKLKGGLLDRVGGKFIPSKQNPDYASDNGHGVLAHPY